MYSVIIADKRISRADRPWENSGLISYRPSGLMKASSFKQRVNFARSLVNDPHILVLDEPTGNLDSTSSDQVLRLLQDLNRQRNRTILMITHNLEYLPLADRTIMVRDGLITEIKEQEGKQL
jgi:ABC-type lipoprotein export system ATPase subunit